MTTVVKAPARWPQREFPAQAYAGRRREAEAGAVDSRIMPRVSLPNLVENTKTWHSEGILVQ